MSLQDEIDEQSILWVARDLREIAIAVTEVWRNTKDPVLASSLAGIWNRIDAARAMAEHSAGIRRHNEMEK